MHCKNNDIHDVYHRCLVSSIDVEGDNVDDDDDDDDGDKNDHDDSDVSCLCV